MIKKIDKMTIVRTVFLGVALINQLLVAIGKSPIPFNQDNFQTVFSFIWTGVASAWAWWKNNDISKKARTVEVAEAAPVDTESAN